MFDLCDTAFFTFSGHERDWKGWWFLKELTLQIKNWTNDKNKTFKTWSIKVKQLQNMFDSENNYWLDFIYFPIEFHINHNFFVMTNWKSKKKNNKSKVTLTKKS